MHVTQIYQTFISKMAWLLKTLVFLETPWLFPRPFPSLGLFCFSLKITNGDVLLQPSRRLKENPYEGSRKILEEMSRGLLLISAVEFELLLLTFLLHKCPEVGVPTRQSREDHRIHPDPHRAAHGGKERSAGVMSLNHPNEEEQPEHFCV